MPSNEPTSVHWHGIRLDNRFDGAVGHDAGRGARRRVVHVRVRFPDAGIYWYHAHVREDIAAGAGSLRQHAGSLDASRGTIGPVNREEVLMIGDSRRRATDSTPFGADAPTHALMGRFGNVFLVNGEPRYSLDVRRGDVVRFYLTNVSSARPYNLSFAGDARMKVVAGDGGKFEREEWVSSVVMAPAERYVVDVRVSWRRDRRTRQSRAGARPHDRHRTLRRSTRSA